MKKYKITSVLLFFLFFAGYSQAEGTLPGLNTNGCGTEGIQGILVPDSTLFTKCQFHNACNKHDLCYGKCLEGGSLFGKESCNDPIAKESRRKACDTNFFNDIIEDNDDRSICKFYGKIYRLAVVKFGKGNFNGREIEELAKSAFDKGDIEAEKFYKNLSIVQEATFSPRSLKLDHFSKEIIFEQKAIEMKLDHIKLDSMANKTLQQTNR